MDLYEQLLPKGCFSHSDMVELTGSDNTAQWQIKKFLTRGYIERVRRDLYAVVDQNTGKAIPTRFQIASRIAPTSYVSHHSAFEYYEYTEKDFQEVYFSSVKRARPFTYDGFYYHPVVWRGDTGIVELGDGVRITTPERTVIDSIADFQKIGGMDELLHCLTRISFLDENKLLKALELYDEAQLYQKAGYLLEAFNDDLMLSDAFFRKCAARKSTSKTYLFERQEDFVYHEKWLLYAPVDIRRLAH